MVTFVCQNCDVTLKKKQVEGHIRGCYPAAMICIDCSKTFYGNDHKAHISCISEMDKHWGDYAPSKKTKFIGKDTKNGQSNIPNNKKEVNSAETEQEENEKAIKEALPDVEENSSEWRGWKSEIKALIRESEGKVEKQQLIKKLMKIFKKKQGEEISKEEFEATFNEKISKIGKIQETVYYSLE